MSGVATEVALADGIEPFSLYLDLERGRLVDLEVVAKISLSLSAAIREAAFVIDPSINVRIELLSGTEGSFSLNTFIKTVMPKDRLSQINLRAVAYACLLWFSAQSAAYTYEKLLDYLLASPQKEQMSDEDAQKIAKQVAAILSKRISQDQVQSVYRALNAEPAIKAVGATQAHNQKPSHLIPRAEFQSRAGAGHQVEKETQTRTREDEMLFTLISPVLLEESPRKWRLKYGESEFGASIKDEAFLKSLSHGQVVAKPWPS